MRYKQVQYGVSYCSINLLSSAPGAVVVVAAAVADISASNSSSYIITTISEHITTPEMFQGIWTGCLLRPQMTSDYFISNHDVGTFFEHLCESLNIETCKGNTIQFYSLSFTVRVNQHHSIINY